MLEVKNLKKVYGNKVAIHDITFNVPDGEIVGLIGKNGAGKSTILKSIAGLLTNNGGLITFDGEICGRTTEIVRDFGILIECAFLDYISAYDNLRLLYNAGCQHDSESERSVIDAAFDLVGLTAVSNNKVRTYSFGMKQRLGLAQAIINGRKFIILDEPFIGLDPPGKEIVKNVLIKKAKEDGCAILFSSHDLDDVVEICDKVVMISGGICAYDGPIQKGRTYRVSITDMNCTTASLCSQLKTFAEDISIGDGQIIFSIYDNHKTMNKPLSIIGQHCSILDITSEKCNLKNMFAKEYAS